MTYFQIGEEDPLPLEMLEAIDASCDRFEADWKAQRNPRLEEYLPDAADRSEAFRQLLRVEFDYRRKAADAPSLADYQSRFPEHARLVADVFSSASTRESKPAAGEVSRPNSAVNEASSGPTSADRAPEIGLGVVMANRYELREELRREASSVVYMAWDRQEGKNLEFPVPAPFPGEFRVIDLLGEGAVGKVWLAEDLNLGRLVALKSLGDRMAFELLEREGRMAAGFHHPNLVQVYACRQAGDQLFLVLRYVSGGSLAGRLQRTGPLPWRLAARYVADVGEGLLTIHRAGTVHRDIKPHNILWDPDEDEALLTDFGAAARIAPGEEITGTFGYMAPEAVDGEVTPAMDIFSLAATCFALVTGEPPFAAPKSGSLLERIAAARELVRTGLPDPDPRCAAFPGDVEDLIRRGLSFEPNRRPPLTEFVTTLRRLLNQLLADSLTLKLAGTGKDRPVTVEITVLRETGEAVFCPLSISTPRTDRQLRDMNVVPRRPASMTVKTGDRLRIDVTASKPGFVTVFNVGPTGNLNLLYPTDPGRTVRVEADEALRVLEVQLTPPAGQERLAAVWTREPLAWDVGDLIKMAQPAEWNTVTQEYRATRDLVQVQQAVENLGSEDWHVKVLELEHCEK